MHRRIAALTAATMALMAIGAGAGTTAALADEPCPVELCPPQQYCPPPPLRCQPPDPWEWD